MVAGCAYCSGVRVLFGYMPLLMPSAGMCPRRGTFFSCVAKKRRQKKATPLSASPALRYGATCGARVQRGLAQTRFAQTIASPDPLAAALLGAYRGDGEQTSTRAVAALGPTSRAQAPRAGRSCCRAERSDGPSGCLDVRLSTPCWLRLRRGGCGVSTRVGARVLRDLTRRGCPSGAAQQQSEFHGAPRNRPDAGLPRSEAQGSQTGGRLLLPSFLGDARKEGAPPGAYPGTRPQTRHASKPAHKPRIRQAQPERTAARQDAISSVAASAYPISARTQKHPRIQVRSARVSSLSGVISSP